MAGSDDTLPPEQLDAAPARLGTALHIKPWMVTAVAMIAIGCWAAISAWILYHGPSEGERASIMKQAEAVSMMAFGFFLGSSAGSRNAAAAREGM